IRLRPPFRVVWTRGLGSLIEFPAVVDNGVAYIGNAHATIRAISMRTGKVLWRHDTPHGQMASSPAVVGSDLVYHSMSGRVVVLSSTGGSLTAFSTRGRYLWRVNTGSYVYSSPAAWGAGVFFGSYNGVIYGVSAASGRIRWRVWTGGSISGAAVVVDGVAYAGSLAHRIVGVDTRSG